MHFRQKFGIAGLSRRQPFFGLKAHQQHAALTIKLSVVTAEDGGVAMREFIGWEVLSKANDEDDAFWVDLRNFGGY